MKKVAWIISPPTKGSGGFRTICSKAAYLDQHEFESHFFILPGSEDYKSVKTVESEIQSWFGYKPKSISIQTTIPQDFDIAIATAWNTASFVALQRVSLKLYFIQDFEPWFYPMGESYLRAEQSYRLGLKPITIGRWLSSKIRHYYSFDVPYCDFGVNTTQYHLRDSSRELNSICAIYQPNKDRRLSGLLLDALELACSYEPYLNVYLFGSDKKVDLDMCQFHQLGVLTVSECADLYSHCSVGVSLSASNPSRLPFEMLASGLSVVEINNDNTAFDYKTESICFADPTTVGIASAIIEALGKPNTALINLPTLDDENQMFLDAVGGYLKGVNSPIKVAELSRDKHTAVPDNPALLTLSRDKELLDYRIAVESQRVVCANHLCVDLDVPEYERDRFIFRAAYWLKSDQSDLHWCELLDSESGLFADFDFDIPDAEAVLLRIHVYRFNADNSDSLFLGEYKQLVSDHYSDVVVPFDRRLDFGSCHLQVEFSRSLRKADESNSESLSSRIMRIIERK